VRGRPHCGGHRHGHRRRPRRRVSTANPSPRVTSSSAAGPEITRAPTRAAIATVVMGGHASACARPSRTINHSLAPGHAIHRSPQRAT
jgi:hypothetical protein